MLSSQAGLDRDKGLCQVVIEKGETCDEWLETSLPTAERTRTTCGVIYSPPVYYPYIEWSVPLRWCITDSGIRDEGLRLPEQS